MNARMGRRFAAHADGHGDSVMRGLDPRIHPFA
jgi:hypothetical protein